MKEDFIALRDNPAGAASDIALEGGPEFVCLRSFSSVVRGKGGMNFKWFPSVLVC